MLFLNTQDILKIGIPWKSLVKRLEEAICCLRDGHFSQPIKPYLRYRNKANRLIAMPAFVGGKTNIAGIKWIASFPGNIDNGLPRAHSVLVLNDADTGVPVCIINSGILSSIRTAAVSGLMIKYFDHMRGLQDCTVGIIGWGPIGQFHYNMARTLFGDNIQTFRIFDIRPVVREHIKLPVSPSELIIADTWQDAYKSADVLITCTVSSERYIDEEPKTGSLQLNVSLRDYLPQIFHHVKSAIVVDNWDEVCRENTDIEVMHRKMGLKKADTYSLVDVVCDRALNRMSLSETVMFNPMGMAVFDMAIAAYYMQQAVDNDYGFALEDTELDGRNMQKVL